MAQRVAQRSRAVGVPALHPACLPGSFLLTSPSACRRCSTCSRCSIQPEGAHKGADIIDEDGLPHIGAPIWPGQSYYSAVDKLTGAPPGWHRLRWRAECVARACAARRTAACVERSPWPRTPTVGYVRQQHAHVFLSNHVPLAAGRSKGSKLKGEETAVIDQVGHRGKATPASLLQRREGGWQHAGVAAALQLLASALLPLLVAQRPPSPHKRAAACSLVHTIQYRCRS